MSKTTHEALRDLHDAAHELGNALVEAFRLREIVRWLDGRLTRRP